MAVSSLPPESPSNLSHACCFSCFGARAKPPLYSHISTDISSKFYLNAMQMSARKAGWRSPGRLVWVRLGVEAIEPEERMLDGQNFYVAEARLAGVAPERIRAHDGTGSRRWLLGHARWQAEEHACAVHQALYLVGGRGERFANALIHDDDSASLSDQAT